MANNKVKLDPKGVVLERKLEGLEVDLKGEAQVVGYLPGLDLKGEIEKGQAKLLFLTAGGGEKIIRERGANNSSPYLL